MIDTDRSIIYILVQLYMIDTDRSIYNTVQLYMIDTDRSIYNIEYSYI